MGWNNNTLRKTLWLAFIGATALAVVLSFVWFGNQGAILTLISSLCLALGFGITEALVGVFTGVKKANTSAIALLFLAKLGWWLGLFMLSRHYPPGTEIPIAMGLGAFLLALFIASLSHFGWPKISDGKSAGDP